MAQLLEYVGYVHIFLGPYRGNPISLYLRQEGDRCTISPKAYPWNEVIGEGDTPNKAAANFIVKWKDRGLPENVYTGPTWVGGIKPEKPAPPKPAAPPKPTAVPTGGETPKPITSPGTGTPNTMKPPPEASGTTPDREPAKPRTTSPSQNTQAESLAKTIPTTAPVGTPPTSGSEEPSSPQDTPPLSDPKP